jgi:hypothetical protein
VGYYSLSEAADADGDDDRACVEGMVSELGVKFVKEGRVAFDYPL